MQKRKTRSGATRRRHHNVPQDRTNDRRRPKLLKQNCFPIKNILKAHSKLYEEEREAEEKKEGGKVVPNQSRRAYSDTIEQTEK